MSRAPRVKTFAAAARLAGVTPMTIRLWVSKGWLLPAGEGWTAAQLRRAAEAGRQSSGRGSTAEHGTASRWRAGCDCDACGAAHNLDTQQRRREARQAWWVQRTEPLLKRLAGGGDYGHVLADLEVTAAAVTARRRTDPSFAQALDEALMTGRDPDLRHGTAAAWKRRCRCPECREHHDATR